jgi:cytochrome P450
MSCHIGVFGVLLVSVLGSPCVQYETQRLNGSVVFLWRVSGAQTQALNIAGTTHAIPPNTYITVNMHSIHCDQASWGSDADEWRPSRWITKSASGEEELIEPRPGTFMPWAVGPHNCPGRKFAQVEFVSVMTTLFRKHVVSPLPNPGASMEEARAETLRMIKDSAILGPTNRMRDSSRVPMVWKEKAGAV